MSQLDDLEIQGRDPGTGPVGDDTGGRGGRGRGPWVAAVVAFVVLGAAAYVFLSKRAPSEEPALPMAAADATPQPPLLEPEAPTEEADVQLPSLRESDWFVRDLVGELSPHSALEEWLTNAEPLVSFVAAVENLADGLSPKRHLGALAPTGTFTAREQGGVLRVDPQSYRRYDRIAEVFTSIDPEASAIAFRILRPLLDEAFSRMGYPDESFTSALQRSFEVLLQTPIPSGPPELEKQVTTYRYRDPRLESLPDAQKQFLRMGPDNMRRIRSHLYRLAQALELDVP